MSIGRRVLARLAPAPVKRAIDRVRTRRFLSLAAPATMRFVSRYGLEVRAGPFAGMRYLPGLERQSGDVVAKLLGAYECELHPAVHELIAGPFSHLIDVGCAEGYYAIGFARTMPSTTVHAYDIDPGARAACEELARLNDVLDRVVVHAACTPEDLADFPPLGVALFCDCEGYERTLLDPQRAPMLRDWWILVELHDFIEASTTETIRRRFAETHTFELIPGQSRDARRYPELADTSARASAALLSEHRPGAMNWALLRPAPG